MKAAMSVPVLYINRNIALPDNSQWTNRFHIESQTTGNLYTVAQNKKHRHWACSCPGWIFKRKCKHLEALGLPNHSEPFEPIVARSRNEYQILVNKLMKKIA